MEEDKKPEHMDLSLLDENAPIIFDNLLNNERVFCLCF